MMQRMDRKNQLECKDTAYRAANKPSSIPASRPLLQLHQAIGNHGVLRRCKSIFQAKLRIGLPGDRYEQEADRVAEAVMQMPEPAVQRQPDEEEDLIQAKPVAGQITPLVQRQAEPEEDEEEEEPIQTKVSSGRAPAVTPEIGAQIRSLRGRGQPLPESTRAFFEPRFGFDFSRVRVHTGRRAAKTAQALNARAFAVGQNVAFDAGQFTPKTPAGQRLLAHELAHVMQQADSSLTKPTTVARQTRIDVEKPLVIGGVAPRPSSKVKRPAGYEDITTPGKALGKEAAHLIFIPVWDNIKLVQEAKRKDIYLRHYSDDLGPDIQSEIAKTLILMFEEMDRRVKALPLKLGPNGIILPPEGTKWSSENLAGITTAIAPFHMIDWWGFYFRKATPPHRRRQVTRLQFSDDVVTGEVSPPRRRQARPPSQDRFIRDAISSLGTVTNEQKKQARRMRCLLNMLRRSGVDDRFIDPHTLYLYDRAGVPGSFVDPDHLTLPRARKELENLRRNPAYGSEQRLGQAIVRLEERLFWAYRHTTMEWTRSGNTMNHGLRVLRRWILERIQKGNSIYCCYR